MGGTKLHYFNPKSNRQASECSARNEPKRNFEDTTLFAEEESAFLTRQHMSQMKATNLLEMSFGRFRPDQDLSNSDFFLFSDFNRIVAGKSFSYIEEVTDR